MSEPIPVVVLDSSVAYKWFNAEGESHVAEALDLLRRHATGEVVLAAPAHLPSEVVNGLRYTQLDAETLHVAIKTLAAAEIVTIPLDAKLLSTALDLALAHELTVHDALFPALAMRLGCEFVTADRAQARVTGCPVRLLA